jgi:hypothetical protein
MLASVIDAVAILMQRPLKPLYCDRNSGCRLQFKTMRGKTHSVEHN